MTKRRPPADYHALANKCGFKWLGPAVKNVSTKTRWRCPIGHEWETGYRVIAYGSGCPYCTKRIKLPIDYHEIAQGRNFKWMGPEVPNANTKTIWRCPKEHYWLSTYHDINSGRGCMRCADHAQKTPEDYRSLAESRNFKWIGPIVSRTYNKTWWICDNDHRWYTNYSSIQQGYICPYCGRGKKTHRDYHILAGKRGFQWLGKKPSSVLDKTLWECENGHQWEARFDSIRRGSGCPFCAGNARKLPKDYHLLAENRNFQWLGPSVRNNSLKTKWQCEKEHIWEACYADIASGRGCPACANENQTEINKAMWKNGVFDDVFQSPTSIEIALAKALDVLKISHQSQYRPDGYSKVYDEFVFPNIFVEAHGDYWHGNPMFYAVGDLDERQQVRRKSDVEKAAWAKENGYHLVIMWECEINENGAETLVSNHVLPLLEKE